MNEWMVGVNSKTVLDKVSGFCKPGTFTAILGSSGAGKTTLLNILSQRNKEYEGKGNHITYYHSHQAHCNLVCVVDG
jgi:ATP-binding cassette subfamily G (WHITE) protein 2 (SNQ2)